VGGGEKAYIPQGRGWFVLSFFLFIFPFQRYTNHRGVLDKHQPKNLRTKNYFLAGITRKRVYMAAMAHWYFGEEEKKMKETAAAAAFWRCYFALTVSVQRNRSMWLVPLPQRQPFHCPIDNNVYSK
jgi:hypothetical protein